MLPTSKKAMNLIFFFLGKAKFQIFLLARLLITFLIGHLLGMSLASQLMLLGYRTLS